MAELTQEIFLGETPFGTVPTESNPTGYATKLQEVSLVKIR